MQASLTVSKADVTDDRGSSCSISYGKPGRDMTAILRFRLADGFVIAADGLTRDMAGGEVSATTQKVFPVRLGERSSFAYGMTGTTNINQIANFRDEAASIIKEMSSREGCTRNEYLEEFSKMLLGSLQKAHSEIGGESFSGLVTRELIMSVLFAGYYEGQPFRADIHLLQRDFQIQVPVIEIKPYIPLEVELKISGSTKIWNRLDSGDEPRLSFYNRIPIVKKFRERQPLSLPDAVDLAKTYLAACSSPRGREIDPEEATFIGGHACLATITEQNGFAWIIPPANSGQADH